MKINKKLLALFSGIGIITLVLSLYAFKAHSRADQGYSPQPPWDNLKVLPKDITKDSLIGLMKNYENSLGVKCNYCHATSKVDPTKLDFPNDDKIEKEIARGMIKMTNEINENYFKPYFPDPKPEQVHVVNCVLCHRGTSNPEKYLSQMGKMYKTYDPNRDNRKEKAMEKE
ncbi:Photosynthetic reaction centre cytochrome C subunit [Aequorivita sublithincola DSM 14238]|uniref:Photosynthetic reaction center cytochrome c subunit n=1 Tax=Aequorivita sublithincola (strain DSM 14238 / LMG 21431 / ACAM 643 / 9-3) TaxID=746697 RepID=U3GK00_AEQSU|nr:c-type cytochrome [Aequorivita sublithincola]AFL82321.1 Photosynthetic reaction centre cytochrome C subunit [Aequorivita sublithincola DSM 14238]